MSEPCAFPRPLAVYLASEVISYCKAKRDARMRKSHHDLAAFVAETLEGMAAEGVALNTMAQYLLKEANQRTVLILTETGALASDYKARGFWVTELDHKPTLNPRKRYFLVNHSDSGGLRAWPEWKLEERLEEIGIKPSP